MQGERTVLARLVARDAGRRVLVTTSLIHLLNDACFAILYPLFPLIAADLHLSYAQVGLIKTAFSGTSSVLQLPAGVVGERFGEGLILLLGNAWVGLGLVGMALTSTYLVLLGVALAAGLGGNAQHPLASALVSRAFDGKRSATALGTLNFMGDLGKLLGPLVVGILAVRFGWRAALLGVGLVTALCSFTLLLTQRIAIPELPVPVAAREAKSDEAVEVRHGFSLVLVAGGLDNATRVAALTFLPFLLTQQGASVTVLSLLFSFIFAAGAAGKFACGWLGDRFGAFAGDPRHRVRDGAGATRVPRGDPVGGVAPLPHPRVRVERYLVGPAGAGGATRPRCAAVTRLWGLLHRRARQRRGGTAGVRRGGRPRRADAGLRRHGALDGGGRPGDTAPAAAVRSLRIGARGGVEMAGTVYGSGEYRYQVVPDWGRGPQGVPAFGLVSMVSCDAQDRVYVFQREPDPSMLVFEPDGTLVDRWGGHFFKHPHGNWMASGPDPLPDRPRSPHRHAVDARGELLRTWGTPDEAGAPGAPFNEPTRAIVAPTGDLYVSDGYGQHRAHRFAPDGTLLRSWGEKGTGPGQFGWPVHSVHWHPEGRVMIIDRENHRIQHFTPEGDYLDAWTDFRVPQDLYITAGECHRRRGGRAARHSDVAERRNHRPLGRARRPSRGSSGPRRTRSGPTRRAAFTSAR